MNGHKERILVFEPHPDDVAFQISGSVLKWVSEGREVMICTVTNGNNSTFDPDVTQEMIEETMRGEHMKAVELLGLDRAHVIMLGYDDLGMDPGRDRLALLGDMIRIIRRFRPNTVVTMDPKNAENEENPDHRLVALTGFEAAAMAAYPNVCREHFEDPDTGQHFVSRVLFYMSPEPDTFIEISGFIDKKIQLGLIYESQLDLMLGEGRRRIAGLGVQFPAFEIPKEIIWPQICNAMAAETAQQCRAAYPEREDARLMESFRVQYLGILHKVRGMIPDHPGFE